MIDVSFPLLAHHSPRYVEAARAAAGDARHRGLSHPWVPARQRPVPARAGRVYDAHNVESVLRFRLLGQQRRVPGPGMPRHSSETCAGVLIWAGLPHEDRNYSIRVRPFLRQVRRGAEQRSWAVRRTRRRVRKKRELELGGGPVAVFISSLSTPNVRCDLHRRSWRPAPGHIRDLGGEWGRPSIACRLPDKESTTWITGVIDDATRRDYLAASMSPSTRCFDRDQHQDVRFRPPDCRPFSPDRGQGNQAVIGAALHVCDAGEFGAACGWRSPWGPRRRLAPRRVNWRAAAIRGRSRRDSETLTRYRRDAGRRRSPASSFPLHSGAPAELSPASRARRVPTTKSCSSIRRADGVRTSSRRWTCAPT